jgi:hypothetical protein
MNNIKSQPKLQDNVIEVRFADIILFLKKYFKSLIIAAVISGITGFVFSYLLTSLKSFFYPNMAVQSVVHFLY